MEVEPAISFDNLENAFAYRSNSDIKKAYWLFQAIGNPVLTKVGGFLSEWSLRLHLPVKGLIKKTIFSQFCGGETIAECNHTIEQLGNFHVGSILDYSVEGKENEHEFDHACEEIKSTIRRAKGDRNIPFSVFKVTGLARFALLEKVSFGNTLTLAEKNEYEKVYKRVEDICAEAFNNKVRVFIDAEESWIQRAIDDLATSMMEKYNHDNVVVYNTVQMYRKDRLSFTKESYERSINGNYLLGLKIVRGAYMEKERKRAADKNYPSPIQDTKEATDKDYNLCLEFCIQHIDRISICAGTHNEASSLLLTEMMRDKGLANHDERIYFSQLLGMSDHISFNLAAAGYCVAKYVPYGPVSAVLPYLIRRAQENTSMAGQMGRELGLLTAERKRRKL